MSRFGDIALSMITPSRRKRASYERAISAFNEDMLVLRHEFLQCQGALLSAIWHDPPTLFHEHLEQCQIRLAAFRQRLTRGLARLEHRRTWAQMGFTRPSSRQIEAMRNPDQALERSTAEADILGSDVDRLITLTRQLARGGDRDSAADVLDEVARHYAPTPPPKSGNRHSLLHRSANGFIVEAIPASEWERHANAAGRLVTWVSIPQF